MRFYERFCSFRALSIIGKCTSRHLFAYGGLEFVHHQINLPLTVVGPLMKEVQSFLSGFVL